MAEAIAADELRAWTDRAIDAMLARVFALLRQQDRLARVQVDHTELKKLHTSANAALLARQAALGDLSPEVRAWLISGFRRHVIDGVQLDISLGLDRCSRVRARDAALRRAARLLTLGDEGPWVVAGRLANAVARFERKRGEPATALESALADAFAAGVGVPRTERHLYNLIN